MTASTHTYAAFIIGDEQELQVRGGQITLDAGEAPHVQARIVVPLPDHDTLEALDPRTDSRIRIDAQGVFPSATQARSFDLGVRDTDVDHAEATVTLTLASDEALLSDYAPLTDDNTPRTHETSLRDVIDYVLDTVLSTLLEASPPVDADVTAYWSLTNLVPAPRAETATGFLAGANTSTVGVDAVTGGSTGPNFVYWRAAAPGISDLLLPVGASAKEGPYTASADFLADTSGRSARIIMHAIDTEERIIQQFDGALTTLVNANTWYRLHVTGVMPEGTAKINLVFEQIATGMQAAGVDGLMLTTGDELVPFFTGASSGGGYAYAWSGDTDDSTSVRTPIVERQPESLIWKAGQSALDFLAPLVQAAGYRLVCDENRSWTLRDEGYTAPGSLNIRHGVNLVDGSDTISRDSGLWFDAAVTRYAWTGLDGVQRERIDAYALDIPYSRLRTFEKTTPYPGPGFSEYAVRRAQGRGREVTATSVSDWRARAEQPVSITLDGAPLQTGITQSVEYNLDRDEMTIATRTTDTPPLAWVLGPDDLTWDDAAPVAWADLEEWSDL